MKQPLDDNAVKLRKRHCPHCNHTLDAASAMNGDKIKPQLGDLTVCIGCAEILQFDKNIRPIVLKGMTLDTLDQETLDNVLGARKAILSLHETIRNKINGND